MSAFVVSTRHIDTLLSSVGGTDYVYWKNKYLYFEKERNRLGQELVNQNYRSTNDRYNENQKPPVYLFQRRQPVTPVQILKACDCYEYQACETENYKNTLAYKIIDALRGKAIQQLPGYKEAAWEVCD